jgi:hypothetical protein
MDGHLDYGGECDVIVRATGVSPGRFWIEIEFEERGLPQSVAVLSVPKQLGVELMDAGPLLLALDDGRKLHGTVSQVLGTEAVVALTRLL